MHAYALHLFTKDMYVKGVRSVCMYMFVCTVARPQAKHGVHLDPFDPFALSQLQRQKRERKDKEEMFRISTVLGLFSRSRGGESSELLFITM